MTNNNNTTAQSNNANNQQPLRMEDTIPEPVYDKNLNDEEREKIRAERAAAAEARLKKMGGGATKRPPNKSSDEPLRGPNSKPLMTWTAG